MRTKAVNEDNGKCWTKPSAENASNKKDGPGDDRQKEYGNKDTSGAKWPQKVIG